MARRSVDKTSCTTPSPPDNLHTVATFFSLAKGKVLHRVHKSDYRANQFNPRVDNNARFSSIYDIHVKLIPTLYGGKTMDCALMETVFHDVPYTAGFKSIDKKKLVGQVHSTVRVEQTLKLIDLASVHLRKLGVERKQLIDTEKDQYPATRKWAEAFHHQCPKAQGLSWISRQDDTSRAYVLFGDRIPGKALRPVDKPRSLLDDTDAYEDVLDLAKRIGVEIVPGIS